jgi:hypothetical protein
MKKALSIISDPGEGCTLALAWSQAKLERAAARAILGS